MPLSAARIVNAGIAGLRDLYQRDKATPVTVCETYLRRIQTYNPALNAVSHVLEASAKEQAAASAARYAKRTSLSPLDGVPIAVKANIAVKDAPWHGGIEAYKEQISEKDAAVVEKLKAAGAVIIGLLNMEEGALGAKTDNPWLGACYNPHKEGHTPGGSSGGSGAAVAAGLCAAALGTDTMGSVRIPSAYCGVYGLKPSAGAVAMGGVMPLSHTFDHVGPHARSVKDVQLLFNELMHESDAGTASALADTSFGVLSCDGQVEVSDDVMQAFRKSVSLMEGHVSRIKTVCFTDWDFARMRRAGLLVSEAEGWAAHEETLTANPAGFSEAFSSLLKWGNRQSDHKKKNAYAALRSATELKAEYWPDSDILLMPTAPQNAFPMADDAPVNQADFTCYANFAGLPALSMPTGFTKEGLPTSIQLVAGKGEERELLAIAGSLAALFRAYAAPHGYGFQEKSGSRFSKKALYPS